MPKKPEAYYRPQSLDEALHLLAQPHTVALGGGTQLLASEEGLSEAVVDLQDLGLDKIALRDGVLQIGAMTTLDALERFLTREQSQHDLQPLLQQVIKQAGPNTYRHAATIGGVIASRLVDSELLSLLLVLDAEVHFASPELAPMQLASYLDAPDLPPRLISAVHVPWAGGQGATERVARTPADYPIVSVTAWQHVGAGVRLAATGLAPRPQRLPAAETVLVDGLDEATISAAADAVQTAASHPGDFRGDAAYRAAMGAVLTRRVLLALNG